MKVDIWVNHVRGMMSAPTQLEAGLQFARKTLSVVETGCSRSRRRPRAACGQAYHVTTFSCIFNSGSSAKGSNFPLYHGFWYIRKSKQGELDPCPPFCRKRRPRRWVRTGQRIHTSMRMVLSSIASWFVVTCMATLRMATVHSL